MLPRPLAVPSRPPDRAGAGAALPPPPPPRVTGRGLAAFGAGWVVFAAVYGLVLAAGGEVPLAWALGGQGMLTGVLVALGVLPWLLVVRGLDGRPRAQLAAHAVLLPLLAVVGAALYVGLLGTVAGPEASAAVRAVFGWVAFEGFVGYAILFAGLHAALASGRTRLRERQATAALALAREGELRALKAQLHPHFLFNALNAVAADVGRDPDGAREALATLGDLLRYALDAGGRDLVPLADEIAFARGYLALEERRMGERLRVGWDVDDGALGAAVPPLALQTLVENAVQHGVAPVRAGGAVAVSVRREGGAVHLSVRDDGVGAPDGALRPGVGLANADERLRLLFGDDAGLRLATGLDGHGGFEAAFSVPAPPDEAEGAPSGDGVALGRPTPV